MGEEEYEQYYCPDCWEDNQLKTLMDTIVDKFGELESYYCPIHRDEYTFKASANFDDFYIVGGPLDD